MVIGCGSEATRWQDGFGVPARRSNHNYFENNFIMHLIKTYAYMMDTQELVATEV